MTTMPHALIRPSPGPDAPVGSAAPPAGHATRLSPPLDIQGLIGEKPSMEPALAETADFFRVDASTRLDSNRRSSLGQFMTPAPIARFLASLFQETDGDVRLLDPGAGVGSLTAAFAERLCREAGKPRRAALVCYEVDPVMIDYLRDTLRIVSDECEEARIRAEALVREQDFVLAGENGLFDAKAPPDHDFTHVIMNPPYRKIGSKSSHRAALRHAGLEATNLYAGFMFLAAKKLRIGGEMVAIVPRSFCNGPYFRPFRAQFLSMMALRRIHVFETRDANFQDDGVLQENVVVHAVKGATAGPVTITSSGAGDFEWHGDTLACASPDMTRHTVPADAVVRPDDPEKFITITTNALERRIVERMSRFRATLDDLGLDVSTGPVVEFRLKDDLLAEPEDGSVPMLYPAHFRSGRLEWPKRMKKPNAIRVSASSRKWLWDNAGHFVVTRRFTSKEENRRIVASTYGSELPGDLVGFENHLNVFHESRKGMQPALARGLAIYLNSSLVDRYFRQFNGHTQVNATDLRALRYPGREALTRIGSKLEALPFEQRDIDRIVDEEFKMMAEEGNPVQARRKIDEALEALKALGLPRGQQNDRSALTLLALLGLKPDGTWGESDKPLMGITPIIEFAREHYGVEYAPNTRETFRRQTMHQFVEAGIATYNPDDPGRPVNSPNACYQVSGEALDAVSSYGSERWPEALADFQKKQPSLAEKYASPREMRMVQATLPNGSDIALTPGAHSELIARILSEFAPRFAPGASVIYVGDTGAKVGLFDRDGLASLGVTVDTHGKMPDVVLHCGDRDWLLLIESVTSHGPVDSKRRQELADLFASATPGLVYVTAFPDRAVMGRHLRGISWETEVWCADSPSHLIHFNGERFLGPY